MPHQITVEYKGPAELAVPVEDDIEEVSREPQRQPDGQDAAPAQTPHRIEEPDNEDELKQRQHGKSSKDSEIQVPETREDPTTSTQVPEPDERLSWGSATLKPPATDPTTAFGNFALHTEDAPKIVMRFDDSSAARSRGFGLGRLEGFHPKSSSGSDIGSSRKETTRADMAIIGDPLTGRERRRTHFDVSFDAHKEDTATPGDEEWDDEFISGETERNKKRGMASVLEESAPEPPTSKVFEDSRGKKAMVEEDEDVEYHGRNSGFDEISGPHEDTRPEMSDTRGNESSVLNDYLDNQSHSVKELPTSRKSSISSNRATGSPTDSTVGEGDSSGVQVSSGSAEIEAEEWDSSEIEPARVETWPRPPRTSRRRRVPHPSVEDYQRQSRNPQRQPRSGVSEFSSSEGYPPSFMTYDPYGGAAPPFSPPLDPYGYPIPSYVRYPYVSPYETYGNPFAPPPRPYPNHSAFAGMRSGPFVPSVALVPPPPPTPPPPSLNNGDARRSNSAKENSDSGEPGPPYPSRRKKGFKSSKWTDPSHRRRPAYNRYRHMGAGWRQRDQTDFKCHPYKIPFGKRGEPLSVNIKICGPDTRRLLETNSWWPSGQCDHIWTQSKPLNIVGAKRWFDSESHHTLDLTCSSGTNEKEGLTKDSMRWLHVEQQHMDFDEFKAIVLSCPNLSRDWGIVLLSLLKRIQKLHYDQSTNRFLPWTLRADSSELGLPGAGDSTLSATSISFPYFALGSVFGHGPRNTDQQYPIMSLFEWDDRFESAKEWDSKQSFRLMNDGLDERESIIYVPHVWALAFKDTIITYGQVAYRDLVENGSIEVLELESKVPGRATSVEVTDFQGCKFAFSLNQCGTFFALKQSIKVRCFVESANSFDNTDIITPDNQVVDGEKWVSLLQEHGSSAIRLQLRHKRFGSTVRPASKPAGHSEAAEVIESGAVDRASENARGAITFRLPIEANTGDVPQSESSSESDFERDEGSHYALALIPRRPRPEPQAPLQQYGGLGPYDSMALTLNRPNVPPLPPATQQATLNDYVPTSAVSPEPNERRMRLEEKGVIVFDTGAIETSPEIYALPSAAVAGFRPPSRAAASIYETSSVHSKHRERPPRKAALEQPEAEGHDDTTETNDPNKQSRIAIPHFLSWATSQEPTKQDTLSESSIEAIMKVLDKVHETLQTVKGSRNGRAYRRSREVAQIELEDEFPALRARKSGHTPWSSLDAAENAELDKLDPLITANVAQNHPIRANLFRACNIKLRYLHTVLKNFLSLYVPLSSPSASDHPLLQKCWGALGTILAAITSGVQTESQALKYKDPEWWIVSDPSALSLLDRRKPTVSWKECIVCRNSTQYDTLREAMNHVRLHHYGLPGSEEADEETLALWLRNDDQFYGDHRLELYIHCLTLIVDPLREVYNKGRSIWDGVASDNSSMPSRFMLPKSLVNAFENAVLLLVCAAKSFAIINRCSDPINQYLRDPASKIKKEQDLLETMGKDLLHIGTCAKDFMNKAEQDVTLMAYTDIDTETVSYDSVGPEYILATIMTSLFHRPLYADEPIDLVYAGFYRKLQRDAMKHPRTRVLRQIWRMCEELDLVASINMQQQELLRNYLRILEPCTFRATTFIRAARFRVEASFIDTQLRKAHSVRLRISDLDSRLEDVSSHVSSMLEIQQENNGNAIIVFTIVTIIFLPLSWATSYLGMNTSDIRDLSQGQWLFWLIALPVTTVVIGIAMLVVMKGESIREFFIRRQGAKDRQSAVSHGLSTKTRLSTRMTGASLAQRQSTMMSDNHAWRGFRRRTTTARGDGEV